MRLWVNILSACAQVPASALPELAQTGSVPIYSATKGPAQEIGRTLRYEVRDTVDLWAECEVGDCNFQRAAGLVSVENGPKLLGVLATNLERTEIRRLSAR